MSINNSICFDGLNEVFWIRVFLKINAAAFADPQTFVLGDLYFSASGSVCVVRVAGTKIAIED